MVLDVPQEERAQIDAVEHRLAQKYAELPHDHVAGVVQHVYARFNQSKLREFVPLLIPPGCVAQDPECGRVAPRRFTSSEVGVESRTVG